MAKANQFIANLHNRMIFERKYKPILALKRKLRVKNRKLKNAMKMQIKKQRRRDEDYIQHCEEIASQYDVYM